VIYGGVDGTRQAILALRSLRDMLGGVHQGSVSVKWDGAPAVFAGQDPSDGAFFVAKKGVFNKNPKVYKTAEQIDQDMSGDLANKMKAALLYLPELGIKGVVQGDFLFGPGDLKKEKIHGEKYITFHPNTIVYAVPLDSPEAKTILKSKIGIVWHTSYSGSTFENMKASYGVDVTKFKKSRNVWSQDAMLRDMTNATMSKQETEQVTAALSEAGKIFNQIKGSTLRELERNRDLAIMIETFNNSFVRKGEVIKDTKKHVEHLIHWIHQKFEKEIQKRKTVRGQTTQIKKRDQLLKFFSNQNKQNLVKMFDLQKAIVTAKIKLINTLNRLQRIGTFVKTRYGFKTTGHEGYVSIDKLGGNALKIVDRMEFSHNNFNPDILKGWQR